MKVNVGLVATLWVGCLNGVAQSQPNTELAEAFEFSGNGWYGCVQELADSALIWEEKSRYTGTHSLLSVETCESVSATRFTFWQAPALGSTEVPFEWPRWLAQMAKSGVPEAEEILLAWKRQGNPTLFEYSFETHGGYEFSAEPGRMEWAFFSAF